MNVFRGVGTKRVASTGSFTNHGGPVVRNPVVKLLFWGAKWQANDMTRLTQFFQDLVASSMMNLLAQYGVGQGSVNPTPLVDQTVAGTLADVDIQFLVQAYYRKGMLPEPDGNQVLMILLDETIGVNDPAQGLVLCEPSGDTAFGYHNFFRTAAGNPAYYAIIPALTDLCVTESCQGSSGCTLKLSDTQEQRRTEVATHEFAEMVTDPQLNAWIDASGNEIGDVCGGINGTITVNGRSWKVQQEWDNAAGVCALGVSAPPPPPVPGGPPPPNRTGNADVTLLNLLAYAFARLIGKA